MECMRCYHVLQWCSFPSTKVSLLLASSFGLMTRSLKCSLQPSWVLHVLLSDSMLSCHSLCGWWMSCSCGLGRESFSELIGIKPHFRTCSIVEGFSAVRRPVLFEECQWVETRKRMSQVSSLGKGHIRQATQLFFSPIKAFEESRLPLWTAVSSVVISLLFSQNCTFGWPTNLSIKRGHLINSDLVHLCVIRSLGF